MMIVMPMTAVITGKSEQGPEVVPLTATAMIFGKPEARHARFLGYVRGLHEDFTNGLGATDGSAGR